MIEVTIKKSAGRIAGFTYKGHAGYAEQGEDIVCAAVTAQLMMAYNGLDQILGIPLDLKMESEGGYLSFELADATAEEADRAQLMMETLKLGLTAIQMQYQENITLNEEEV